VGYHPPDYYHVEVRTANESEVVFGQESFEDASVETKVFVDFTDTEEGDFRYGLAVRAVDEEQFYAFTIDPRSQSWQALKHSAGDVAVLVEGAVENLAGLASGERDILRVDAQGATFVFHVNGEPVAQVEDADYASGEVGFYVETLDETLAHIHYDALVVQEVDTSAFDVLAPAEAPAPEIPAGMALVPAGYFEMGTSSGRAYEGPAHPVFLNAFYMDLYEVTNAQYRECVQARSCTQAGAPNSATRTGYRDDLAYNDYPIIRVTWDQANAYCQWADKHLPTEAQWEYAASGPDHLNWPWGGTFQGSLLPASESDTQAVGSYPDGASPFGLFDMAGNVAEWVLDDFDETFYAAAPPSNPVSADVSAGRVFRGGSFGDRTAALYATSRRDGNIRTYSDIDVGFRCALDASELTPSEERATLVAEFCEVYATYKPGAVCP
jgi:formylglycine-generating enzyme required for sulfatase activity